MKFLEKIKSNYVLISILLVGIALRFYKINFQSVWLDEIITMLECDPKATWKLSYQTMIIRENNPLIYYFSVKLLTTIFGGTTFVVRMFSAVIGVVGIYAIYLLGKEIQNKKTGLIAAALLTINYFHIYYSQEARPYGLLTVFTIFSFYRLIIFLKNSNLKNSIYYGLAAMLLINTHFFGLFVLMAQAFAIAFFFFDVDKSFRKKYFLLSSLSGAIAVIFWYYFSWEIFKIASEIKVFWIPAPTPELITGIFREFFGNSEILIFMVLLLSIYYFVKLFNEKENNDEKIVQRKKVFGFIILLLWVVITIAIPLIRSYLQIPMITSRYLIVVMPAILLVLAISLNNINDKIIRNTVITFFIVASLTDLFAFKKYYTEIKKTQFRELAAKVNEKNIAKDKIVAFWGWHFSYFFNNGVQKNELIEKSLQDYVNELMAKPDGKSFWYVEAHSRPYTMTPEGEKFLADNYNVVENYELYDCWAKYYAAKASPDQTILLDINKFEPLKSDNSVNILLFSNSTTKSQPTELAPGNYRLAIKARSIPETPLNGENAHITLALSGNKIGACFLSEKEEKMQYFAFKVTTKQTYTIDITFDNDLVLDTADRNALIFSAVIEKVNK